MPGLFLMSAATHAPISRKAHLRSILRARCRSPKTEIVGRRQLSGDVEITEPLEKALGEPFLVALVEVVRPEVMVFGAIAKDEKDSRGVYRAAAQEWCLRAAPALGVQESCAKIRVGASITVACLCRATTRG